MTAKKFHLRRVIRLMLLWLGISQDQSNVCYSAWFACCGLLSQLETVEPKVD